MKRDLLDSFLIGTIITYAAPFIEMNTFERTIIAAGIGALVFGLMLLFGRDRTWNE